MYEQIRKYLRAHYGIVAQSCWIADRKAAHRLVMRSIRTTPRVKPCPGRHIDKIDIALRELGCLRDCN